MRRWTCTPLAANHAMARPRNAMQLRTVLGEAGAVVDGDVDRFPARADVAPHAGAGTALDPVAGPVEAAQLLRVEVHELAGVTAAIPVRRFGWLQAREPVQAKSGKHRAHRRDSHFELGRDARRGEPKAPQLLDQRLDRRRRATRHAPGHRRTITKLAVTGSPPSQPPIRGPFTHPEPSRYIRDLRLLLEHPSNQHLAIRRDELGVTVNTHRDPPWG